MRYDFEMKMTNTTDAECARELQRTARERAKRAGIKLDRPIWPMLVGVLIGFVVAAGLDVADLHFCAGQCDGQSIWGPK